jgi:hypothetical protein
MPCKLFPLPDNIKPLNVSHLHSRLEHIIFHKETLRLKIIRDLVKLLSIQSASFQGTNKKLSIEIMRQQN